MQFDSVALVVAIEIVAVLLVLLAILFVQNRSLRAVTKQLQARMTQLVAALKAARAEKKAPPANKPKPTPPAKTFIDVIDDAMADTLRHHTELEPGRDIALDLAPDTALPKRTAALRYALLLAEKEAHTGRDEHKLDPDWARLRDKYEQIFNFYEDYSDVPATGVNDTNAETLTQELINAKKRINNLEKFKALYFDLEEQWEQSKNKAKSSYDDLSMLASQTHDKEKFDQALHNYRSAYDKVDRMIQVGIGDPDIIVQTVQLSDEESAGELRQLRTIAADQHALITTLQEQLKNASSEEERSHIVASLQDELERQKRFMQESETCIQLMEVELQNAQKENAQLKNRLESLPRIKAQLQEAQHQKDKYELKVHALSSENSKLTKKVNERPDAKTVDSGELDKLKKDLSQLRANYVDLEEKYLDLKVKQQR